MPLLATFAGASARGLGFQAGAAEIPGLQLISTQSFTSVSSLQLDNVFSDSYVQYKIVVDVVGTSTGYSNMRFVTAGTPNSGTIYNKQVLYGNASTEVAARTTSQNTMVEVFAYEFSGGGQQIAIIEVLNPFQSTYTSMATQHQNNGTTTLIKATAFGTNVTTSFDGFQLGTTTNVTGTVSVYGYYKG